MTHTVVALLVLLLGLSSAASAPASPTTRAAPAEMRLPDQPLATTYTGPSSCAAPGFLTGDTVGDGNPAALQAMLCNRPDAGH
jgi:hypothetical protein